MNEAETCRTMVRPRLEAAGWLANGERHYREQLHITAVRSKPKRQGRPEAEGPRLPFAVTVAKADSFQWAKDTPGRSA